MMLALTYKTAPAFEAVAWTMALVVCGLLLGISQIASYRTGVSGFGNSRVERRENPRWFACFLGGYSVVAGLAVLAPLVALVMREYDHLPRLFLQVVVAFLLIGFTQIRRGQCNAGVTTAFGPSRIYRKDGEVFFLVMFWSVNAFFYIALTFLWVVSAST